MNAVPRYNQKIGDYNAECRRVLELIKSRTMTTTFDVAEHFEFTKNKADRCVLTLMQKGFIRQLDSVERRGHGARKRYAQQYHTDDTLDRQLPVDRETAERHGYALHGNLTAADRERTIDRGIDNRTIRRDPLAIYLMGVGEAPSLTFRRTNGVAA